MHDTSTSLILSRFGSSLRRSEVLDVLFQGQSEVVEGLVASHGNAPIQRLAFTFWSEYTYMQIQPGQNGRMNWLMLARTYKGVVQFMEELGWMALRLTVLDDEVGQVGRGSLTLVPEGVGLNRSSLVRTS